jgi:hypothetical protein
MPFVMIRSIVDNWRIFVILIDVNGPSIAEGDVSI